MSDPTQPIDLRSVQTHNHCDDCGNHRTLLDDHCIECWKAMFYKQSEYTAALICASKGITAGIAGYETSIDIQYIVYLRELAVAAAPDNLQHA